MRRFISRLTCEMGALAEPLRGFLDRTESGAGVRAAGLVNGAAPAMAAVFLAFLSADVDGAYRVVPHFLNKLSSISGFLSKCESRPALA